MWDLSGRELLFHVWTTSLSVIPCCSAWSSRKSNKYWGNTQVSNNKQILEEILKRGKTPNK